MTTIFYIAAGLGAGAVFEDLRHRSIPNWLTAAATVAGVAYAAASGWRTLGIAIAGALAGFLVMLPWNLCGAMGGGDVKLTAAFGTLLGPAGILAAVVLGSVAGGVWAVVAALRGKRSIPYAPAIVAGAWLILLGGGS
jgi:prepilin peptidase CpaA